MHFDVFSYLNVIAFMIISFPGECYSLILPLEYFHPQALQNSLDRSKIKSVPLISFLMGTRGQLS